MISRARRATPFLALLVGFVTVTAPAVARSRTVSRGEGDPSGSVLDDDDVHNDVHPAARPNHSPPAFRLPHLPVLSLPPPTARNPSRSLPKPEARSPPLARRATIRAR